MNYDEMWNLHSNYIIFYFLLILIFYIVTFKYNSFNLTFVISVMIPLILIYSLVTSSLLLLLFYQLF